MPCSILEQHSTGWRRKAPRGKKPKARLGNSPPPSNDTLRRGQLAFFPSHHGLGFSALKRLERKTCKSLWSKLSWTLRNLKSNVRLTLDWQVHPHDWGPHLSGRAFSGFLVRIPEDLLQFFLPKNILNFTYKSTVWAGSGRRWLLVEICTAK